MHPLLDRREPRPADDLAAVLHDEEGVCGRAGRLRRQGFVAAVGLGDGGGCDGSGGDGQVGASSVETVALSTERPRPDSTADISARRPVRSETTTRTSVAS